METEFRRIFMCLFAFNSRFALAAAIVYGAALSMALSAATLSVRDESGDTTTLEIQNGNSVSLSVAANGNLTLILDGYYATVSDSASSGNSGSGSTDSGSSGSGSTDSGNSGSGDSDSGGSGSGGTDSGSSGSGGTDSGSSGSGSTDSGSSGSGSTDSSTYCAGNDGDLSDCKASQNFDPWVAGTGETPVWIRKGLTEVFPFTLPARSDYPSVKYGYLQMTSPERERDPAKEDVFHAWFSETPNGAPLGGAKCEIYLRQARDNFYWTQDPRYAKAACYLGDTERVLYVNFETRCYVGAYTGSGTCTADNKLKSLATYQFDVARRLKN
jgi:hypothetical protein